MTGAPMGRRKDSKAVAETAQYARWRYLLRNPEFRADINDLRRLSQAHDSESLAQRVLKERKLLTQWKLFYIPQAIRLPKAPGVTPLPELTTETVPDYEKLFEPPFDLSPIGPLVSSGWGETGEEDSWRDLADGLLRFTVDLNYPDELILSLIQVELRSQRECRALTSEHRPKPYRRLRVDKADFQLTAYDLAKGGETFGAIAKALEIRPSTAKSAYAVAARNIFFPAKAPSKREVVLSDFDPHTHMQKCTVCRAAQRAEDFCPPVRRWVGLDERGQREITGLDTVRDVPDPTSFEDSPNPSPTS